MMKVCPLVRRVGSVFCCFRVEVESYILEGGGLIEEGQSPGDKCSMKMWSQGGEEESEPRGKPRVTTELEKRRQNLRKVEALADYYSEA